MILRGQLGLANGKFILWSIFFVSNQLLFRRWRNLVYNHQKGCHFRLIFKKINEITVHQLFNIMGKFKDGAGLGWWVGSFLWKWVENEIAISHFPTFIIDTGRFQMSRWQLKFKLIKKTFNNLLTYKCNILEWSNIQFVITYSASQKGNLDINSDF